MQEKGGGLLSHHRHIIYSFSYLVDRLTNFGGVNLQIRGNHTTSNSFKNASIKELLLILAHLRIETIFFFFKFTLSCRWHILEHIWNQYDFLGCTARYSETSLRDD